MVLVGNFPQLHEGGGYETGFRGAPVEEVYQKGEYGPRSIVLVNPDLVEL